MGLSPRRFHPAWLARPVRAWEATWNGLADNLRGAVWQVLSNFAFAVMAVAVKTVGQSIDSFEIAFFRCFFGLLLTLPFLVRAGRAGFATTRMGAHFSRAALGVSARDVVHETTGAAAGAALVAARTASASVQAA